VCGSQSNRDSPFDDLSRLPVPGGFGFHAEPGKMMLAVRELAMLLLVAFLAGF